MRKLILCGILFIIVFSLRFITHLYLNGKKKTNTKKKLNQIGEPIEIQYLIKRFNLVPEKLKLKRIGLGISFIDAFIFSSTIYVASLVSDKVLIEIFVGMIMVFALIFGLNEMYGKFLKRKGYDKKWIMILKQ